MTAAPAGTRSARGQGELWLCLPSQQLLMADFSEAAGAPLTLGKRLKIIQLSWTGLPVAVPILPSRQIVSGPVLREDKPEV